MLLDVIANSPQSRNGVYGLLEALHHNPIHVAAQPMDKLGGSD